MPFGEWCYLAHWMSGALILMACWHCDEGRPIKPVIPPFQNTIPSSTPGPGCVVVFPAPVLINDREASRREVLEVIESWLATPALFQADNKRACQRMPLPSGISFLGRDFILLYRDWHTDSGEPTGSCTWAWCLTAADSCLVKVNFTVKLCSAQELGNYHGRTNANEIPVQGRNSSRDGHSQVSWVCLQLFWGKVMGHFPKGFWRGQR